VGIQFCWARVTVTDESSAFSPTLEMVAALYNGVLNGGIPSVSPYCPSGNCTWPVTPSLAICGECETLNFSISNTYSPGCTEDTNDPGCQPDLYNEYLLASGRHLLMWNAAKYDSVRITDAVGFYSNTTFRGDAIPLTQDTVRDYLVIMDLFGHPYGTTGKFDSVVPAYHQCSLWTCIQHYNTSVVTGEHIEDVVEVNNAGSSAGIVGEGAFYTFGPVNPRDDVAHHINYTATSMALSVVKYFLEFNFAGNVTVSSTDLASYTSVILRGIWNGTTDADAWIKNVATSMTNVIRSNQTISWQRDEYNGTQFELAVRVRWLWIILPATLVLSSIVFMTAVMIRTAHSPVRSWKGSPLTILLFDLDVAIRDVALEQLEQHNGVEKTVGGQTVRLVRTIDGRRKFEAS
jgi:hypothetical protein